MGINNMNNGEVDMYAAPSIENKIDWYRNNFNRFHPSQQPVLRGDDSHSNYYLNSFPNTVSISNNDHFYTKTHKPDSSSTIPCVPQNVRGVLVKFPYVQSFARADSSSATASSSGSSDRSSASAHSEKRIKTATSDASTRDVGDNVRINQYGEKYENGKAISMKERAQMVILSGRGHTVSQISKTLGRSHGCVNKILGRFRETSSIKPGVTGCKKKSGKGFNHLLGSIKVFAESNPALGAEELFDAISTNAEFQATVETQANAIREYCRTRNFEDLYKTLAADDYDEEDEALKHIKLPPTNRRQRRAYTESELSVLESCYQQDPHPNKATKEHLARYLNISFERITTWFSNRRAKQNRNKAKESAGPCPVQQNSGSNGHQMVPNECSPTASGQTEPRFDHSMASGQDTSRFAHPMAPQSFGQSFPSPVEYQQQLYITPSQPQGAMGECFAGNVAHQQQHTMQPYNFYNTHYNNGYYQPSHSYAQTQYGAPQYHPPHNQQQFPGNQMHQPVAGHSPSEAYNMVSTPQ